jgi:hypothetical protein
MERLPQFLVKEHFVFEFNLLDTITSFPSSSVTYIYIHLRGY